MGIEIRNSGKRIGRTTRKFYSLRSFVWLHAVSVNEYKSNSPNETNREHCNDNMKDTNSHENGK